MTRLVRPILLTGMLVLAAWICARAPLPAVSADSPVVGTGPYRAGLVVRFDDGRVESRCVAFQEQEISGLELLQKAGISDIATSPEGAVCSIGGQGCPSDNCFCQCPFPNCEYWAYYHRENGAWSYSQIGPFDYIIRDGSLDGWSWGEGNFSQAVEPPQKSFDDVCPAEASSTATPTATATIPLGAPTAPPQVSFFAASSTLSVGQCTMLSWQTTGAASVTLDGAGVALQGSQQVCPTAAQAWTLIAVNGVGQTTRQVSVTVQGTNPGDVVPTPLPTASPTAVVGAQRTERPTVNAPRQATPTAVLRTPQPVMTQAPQPLPAVTAASMFPTPPPPDFQGGGVPLAPTSGPLPVLTATPALAPTRFEFALPPTETPRPRRVLRADDPTPTPILVARAVGNNSGGSAQASSAATARGAASAASAGAQSAQSRSFSLTLLPGYAAYVVSVAVLLIMGWFMLRRRHEVVRAGKNE